MNRTIRRFMLSLFYWSTWTLRDYEQQCVDIVGGSMSPSDQAALTSQLAEVKLIQRLP